MGWRQLFLVIAAIALLAHGTSSQAVDAQTPPIDFGDLEALSFAEPTASEKQRNQMDVMVIVGTVTATTARVIYEPLVNDESSITLSLILHKGPRTNDVVVKTLTHLQYQSFPYAAAFDTLVPNSTYFVHVQVGTSPSPTYVAVARFRTPPLDISNDKLVVLALSCDRFLDDADDSHWATLAEEVRDPAYYGTVHTGDQIYADSLEVSFRRAANFDATLHAYRGLYRRAFGRPLAQRVLRHGAHYMQVDDHDIVSNWSGDTWYSHHVMMRAGLQAYFEYQYQLLSDWTNVPPCQSGPKEELYRTVYHHVTLGDHQLQLVFADTRFERGLTLSTNQLVSSSQLSFLNSTWAENASMRVLFTSVPLFFHTAKSAAIAHFVDGELYPGHAYFTSTVQAIWSQLPAKTLLLVAGDLHMAQRATVCDASAKCVPQLIASGITQHSTAMEDRRLLVFFYAITQWLQPLACLWGQESVCIRSASAHYGQNYAKLTWDHGQWKSEVVTKEYDLVTETILQGLVTWGLDTRTLVSVGVIMLLRWSGMLSWWI